jgi:hypothetical protein
MEAIPNDLAASAGAARERLSDLARRVAASGGSASGISGSGVTMAAAAREAIFADALLGAMRARLEELKSVAK